MELETREVTTARELAIASLPTKERYDKGDIRITAPEGFPMVDIVNPRTGIPTACANPGYNLLYVMEYLGYVDEGYNGYVLRYQELKKAFSFDTDMEISSIYDGYVPEEPEEPTESNPSPDNAEDVYAALIRAMGRARHDYIEIAAKPHAGALYQPALSAMLGGLTVQITHALEAMKNWFDKYDEI